MNKKDGGVSSNSSNVVFQKHYVEHHDELNKVNGSEIIFLSVFG